MERKKRKLKDSVGSYNESCGCESASTKGYVGDFSVQNFAKILKESSEKKETAVFRKRVSAKAPFFRLLSQSVGR